MKKEDKKKENQPYWHALSSKEIFSRLKTNDNGLDKKEITVRLEKYGKNELKEIKKIRLFRIFLSQFRSFFIYLLFVAVIISALLGHWIDFYAITAIIILNAVIGFTQNYKAEQAIKNLKKVLVPKAKVIRNGILKEINASHVVPGDILVFSEGDKIIADSRIFECHDIQVNEAVLTGESMPVGKIVKKLPIETELSEKTNMLYSGTTIIRGSGRAVVVATSMATEFGKIASMVQEVRPSKTPLQLKIDNFAKKLGVIAIILCAAVAGIGILLGLDKLQAFFTSVSLAVAAVPEGLPAVITICLAIAVKRMYKVKCLVRKLPAAETLGRVSVICTDKTGTLTEEKMTVTELFYSNKVIEFEKEKLKAEIKTNADLKMLFEINCLCNNARIEKTGTEITLIGDPTETALLKAAADIGLDKKTLTEAALRIKEFAFSSKRKRMSIIRQSKEKEENISYVKGAPDTILERCSKELIGGKIIQLKTRRKQELKKVHEELAQKGLRVLGFAFKPLETKSIKPKEKEAEFDLIFAGFQGMIDPPRKEVKQAIANCKDAGIAIKIITGDSPLTTATVAQMIGVEGKIMTGVEIENLSDDELSREITNTVIFARTTPEHKLRIVNLLKKKGEVVAVTGDGVNDAPALKRADIGIAMGIRGTAVARDVSDIVLTDDNFASIAKAVKEGRQIFDNIKKFSYYLISSNLAEIFIILSVLLLSAKMGWPVLLALLPIQILWINLISDGFIAITLSVEQAEINVMKRKPEKAEIFNKRVLAVWIILAAIITAGTILLFRFLNPINAMMAQTIAFTSVVMFEGFNAFNFRSFKQPLYKLKKVNKLLLLAVAFAFLFQIALVNIPALQPIFGTTTLGLNKWLIIAGVSVSILVIGEVFKIIRSRRK